MNFDLLHIVAILYVAYIAMSVIYKHTANKECIEKLKQNALERAEIFKEYDDFSLKILFIFKLLTNLSIFLLIAEYIYNNYLI